MGYKTFNNGLDLFASSKKLVAACYALTTNLPVEEKSNLQFYLRNAALKAHLAIAQGIFLKKKKKRKKFFQKAKNGFIVVEATADVLVEVAFVKEEDTKETMELVSLCYQQTERLLSKK